MPFLASARSSSAGAPAVDNGASDIKDEGVGTYTDPSVAGQISNFSINRRMISCGVGTFASGKSSGPFAMLMFATEIQSYHADHLSFRIQADGRMRSITRVASKTVEDIQHDFLAIAADNRGAKPDRFDVHFTTPFWNPTNPMCTPSTVHPGWCRFGGELVVDSTESGDFKAQEMGVVSVGP